MTRGAYRFIPIALGAALLAGPAVAQQPEPSAVWSWESTQALPQSGSTEEGRTRTAPDFFSGLPWEDPSKSDAEKHLEVAAEQLRRALALMQSQPSLPEVQAALTQARQALTQTQNAITSLPQLPDRSSRPENHSGMQLPERASGGWEG